MKNLKYFLMMFAMVTLLFASCTEEDTTNEEIDPVENTDPPNLTDNPLVDNLDTRSVDGGIELGCFSINLPFSLSVDGEVSEIDSEEDLTILLEGLTEESIVDFVYPFDITFEDGESEAIATAEELGEAFAACIPDDGWIVSDTLNEGTFPAFLINSEEGCFDLVYPVTVTDLVSGDEITAVDESEFITAMTNAESILLFNFPLSLLNEDGEIITANDGAELFDLLLSCEYDGGGIDTTFNNGGDVGCYDIVYPFSVILSDGSEVVVNNHEEYCNLMLNGNITDFVYPITLVDAEGETTTVSSGEELADAFLACLGSDFPGGTNNLANIILADNALNGGEGCYSITFPISIVTDNGILEIANITEAFDLLETEGNSAVVFPIEITPNSTGQAVTVNSMEDVFDIIFTGC